MILDHIFPIYGWGERTLKRAELLHVLQGGVGGRRGAAAAGNDDVPTAAAAAEADAASRDGEWSRLLGCLARLLASLLTALLT